MSKNSTDSKLRLLESAMSHAWVDWSDPDYFLITESSAHEIIDNGKYKIEGLVEEYETSKVRDFREHISELVDECEFVILSKNKRWNIRCIAQEGKRGRCHCLWLMDSGKDTFIANLQNAAHDFRSPLGSIMGLVNLMKSKIYSEDPMDREKVSRYLDMVKAITEKALDLTSEIMEIAEMESESYHLDTKKVVVKDFIQRYLETHRLITFKKRIRVEFESKCMAQAFIHELKFTRALDNIMNNAVKFSPEESVISISLHEEDDKIYLSIKDQGIGMSEEILSNLFIKFGSARRIGLDGEVSSGLGMSIVRQIMLLHKGNVKVSSKEGEGTAIILELKKSV